MKFTAIVLLSTSAVLQLVLTIPPVFRFIVELFTHVDMTVRGIGGPFDWKYVTRGRS